MSSRKNHRIRAAAIAAIVAGLGAIPVAGTLMTPGEAHAVIGRPFTPLSYAGVARRTTRRAVVGTAIVAGTAAHYAAPPMYSLPPGCVSTGSYYSCGDTRYQEAFDGGNVVYIAVDDDD